MSYYETTYQPARTNHVLHLILSLISCGAWLPVWGIVALYNVNRTVPVQTWVSGPHTPSRPVGAYETGWVPTSIDRDGRPPAHQEFVQRREGT